MRLLHRSSERTAHMRGLASVQMLGSINDLTKITACTSRIGKVCRSGISVFSTRHLGLDGVMQGDSCAVNVRRD